uniref:Uncharacterized protein n=1 Tax=Setaria viridis TaxID=4556 RepID=A0A4U6W6Z7_SETVI|nr:hypothetical protein SEVIR_1G044250v2 [Setaria viridis]
MEKSKSPSISLAVSLFLSLFLFAHEQDRKQIGSTQQGPKNSLIGPYCTVAAQKALQGSVSSVLHINIRT